MTSLTINSVLPNLAAKPAIIDRTHHSGPSGGGYHHVTHHSSSKGGGKHSIALSALTLLSFLFFLNILQQCLQDHMDSINPQVVIMQARIKAAREAAAQKRKGEIETGFINTSLVKESRNQPEMIKATTAVYNNKMAQIPVKLKTIQKSKRP